MKQTNNKRGFTLVELLAVIVILALVMGIAAYSMQGVTNNVRISSMKSSALTWIDGVRNMLLTSASLQEGDYYFNSKILRTDVDSPFGGEFVYDSSVGDSGYVKATGTLVCGGASPTGSFVRVAKDATGSMIYSICLHDDEGNYVHATESVLLKDGDKADYYYDNEDEKVLTINATTGKIEVPA